MNLTAYSLCQYGADSDHSIKFFIATSKNKDDSPTTGI